MMVSLAFVRELTSGVFAVAFFGSGCTVISGGGSVTAGGGGETTTMDGMGVVGEVIT